MEPNLIWLTAGGLMITLMAASIVFITRISIQRVVLEERKRMLVGLEHQKELLKSNIQTQEMERERISADLHDSLASKLNVARLMLSVKDAAYTPDTIKKIIDEVIENSRQIAYELYPQSLTDFGLLQVIKDLLRSVSGQIKITFTDLCQQPTTSLSKENEAHLYRIMQEIINNTLKHAGASVLDVVIRISNHSFAMKIADNGNGFDTSKASKGHGRKNIESRAQLVNANFKFNSTPGKGTSFILVIKK